LARKYATDIDRLIFDLLFQKEKPVLYGELYNWVKDGRKKPPSHQTFSRCLSRLQVNSFLGKTSRGYLLRDKAYFLHRLKILEFNRTGQTFLDRLESNEVEKRLKMHFILSYYGSWRGVYRLRSREQFQDFLSRHNIVENDLRVYREYDSENKVPARHIKEFLPDSVYGIEIRILEEKFEETIGRIFYDYFLPGFSIVDILKGVGKHRLEFHYLDPTRLDLQEEIDILLNDGLLDQIGEVDNEIRYRFPQRLHSVLAECWKLNDDVFSIMKAIFEYLRSPKKEEKKWLEFFYGNVEDWLRDLRHNRSTKKGKKKKEILNIRQSMPQIHDNFENLIDSQNSLPTIKYRLFVQKLLEYIYPAFMRRSFSSAIVV